MSENIMAAIPDGDSPWWEVHWRGRITRDNGYEIIRAEHAERAKREFERDHPAREVTRVILADGHLPRRADEMSLSIAQLAVLRLVGDRSVTMFCDKCVWHHRVADTGETINRRTVQALEDAGLVHRSYYRDGAGISLTEAGRKRVAEWDRRRTFYNGERRYNIDTK